MRRRMMISRDNERHPFRFLFWHHPQMTQWSALVAAAMRGGEQLGKVPACDASSCEKISRQGAVPTPQTDRQRTLLGPCVVVVCLIQP